MRTAKFIGTIGVIVAATPLLGLPLSWKIMILVASGLVLIGFAAYIYYIIRKAEKGDQLKEIVTESYVENTSSSYKNSNSASLHGRQKV